MGTVIVYLVVWVIPIGLGYFVGRQRGRRSWLWALLGVPGSWITVIVLLLLPDLSKPLEQRQYEKAAKSQDKSVGRAEKALAKARARKVLGQYGNVILYEDELVTPDGSCQLSPEIKATVQDAGSLQKYVTSRVTLTRAVTIGIFAIGAKKNKTHTVDTRELYLLIETPDFNSLVPCAPEAGPQVRKLANDINNAGKRREALQTERQARIEAAERAYGEATSARAALVAPSSLES